MMRRASAGFAAIALLMWAPALRAQSSATVEVDSARVTVGDRITMTVTVDHPEGATVAWPDSLDVTPFELLESRPLTPSSATFTLTAFELGMMEIPSVDLVVTAPDGTEEVVSTTPYGIEVVSVGTDESGDIRDIRGPLGIPMSPFRLALLILLPLLLAGLLFVLARRLRSRKDEAPRPALGALPRPAHEVALEALAALAGSGMVERGEVKEYHIEASHILRTYVETRFRVEAWEMTTHEVLAGLEAAGVERRFRDGLGAFLEQCDLVKFAKVRPGPDACRELLELGRRLVRDSVPTPEPAGPAPLDSTEPPSVPAGAGV